MHFFINLISSSHSPSSITFRNFSHLTNARNLSQMHAKTSQQQQILCPFNFIFNGRIYRHNNNKKEERNAQQATRAPLYYFNYQLNKHTLS